MLFPTWNFTAEGERFSSSAAETQSTGGEFQQLQAWNHLSLLSQAIAVGCNVLHLQKQPADNSPNYSFSTKIFRIPLL